MKCPDCKTKVIMVLETRPRANGDRYRRYECGNLHRFTTVERVEKKGALGPLKATASVEKPSKYKE